MDWYSKITDKQGGKFQPIIISVEMQSEKALVTLTYNTLYDVITALGGVSAASVPIFNFITPFLML